MASRGLLCYCTQLVSFADADEFCVPVSMGLDLLQMKLLLFIFSVTITCTVTVKSMKCIAVFAVFARDSYIALIYATASPIKYG